jgi:hypothetical protein
MTGRGQTGKGHNVPTDNATESTEVVPVADSSPVLLRPEVVEAYEAMIATVPEAGGEGFEGILAAIALATDVADLDAPWRAEGLKAFVNAPIRVTGIRKMPSDYAGGLPWFLIIDGAIKATGETVAITTGAVSVVAQLVKAWQLGSYPLDVIPRIATRASRNGYFPMHLEIVR